MSFIACLALWLSLEQHDSGTLSAQSIIDLVSDNEKLYSNYDIKYTRLLKGNGYFDDPSPIKICTVSQDNYLYLKKEPVIDALAPKPSDPSSEYCFNGVSSKLKFQNVFNYNNNRLEKKGIFRIHSIAAFSESMFAPFSVWLKGGEALRSHPGARYGWKNAKVVPELVGSTKENGLTILELNCKLYNVKAKKENQKEVFGVMKIWLCPERNYIPTRWTYYEKTNTIPFLDGFASDFYEVEPGIWMPRKVVKNSYDLSLSIPSKMVLMGVEELAIEQVNLNPKYPVSFFDSLEPDKGMLVYNVIDGNIVKSYVFGESWVQGNLITVWLSAVLLAAFLCLTFAYRLLRRDRLTK